MSESLRERIARALRFESASRRQPGLTEAEMPPLAEFPPGVREMYERQAKAALAGIEASGTHVVCPVEPTEGMMAEGCIIAGPTYEDRVRITASNARSCYRAMLAARPRDE